METLIELEKKKSPKYFYNIFWLQMQSRSRKSVVSMISLSKQNQEGLWWN